MTTKYNKIVIGVDQSYTRTGLSIIADGDIKQITSINFKGCKTKSDKRKMLHEYLINVIEKVKHRGTSIQILCERIRTFSHNQGNVDVPKNGKQQPQMFISTDYIKSTGALIATIVDTAYEYGIDVFSVDTRSWKSRIVGSSKSIKGDKKLATIRYICSLGFEDSIKSINKNGKAVYNDDAADSACIGLYGFTPKPALKKEE